MTGSAECEAAPATGKGPMSLAAMTSLTAALLIFVLSAALLPSLLVPDFRQLGRFASTAGTVTSAGTITGKDDLGRTRYFPVVRYRYAVNGADHTGERIELTWPRFTSLEPAQAYAKKWAGSGMVTVWYDPRDPDSAVLRKTWMNWRLLSVLTPVALLAVTPALLWFWIGWSRARVRQRGPASFC